VRSSFCYDSVVRAGICSTSCPQPNAIRLPEAHSLTPSALSTTPQRATHFTIIAVPVDMAQDDELKPFQMSNMPDLSVHEVGMASSSGSSPFDAEFKSEERHENDNTEVSGVRHG